MNIITSGIDFGTTNTSIGFNNGKKSELINLGNSKTDRTSIFYSFENNGEYIVGEKGFQEVLLGEKGRLITSPKKFLSVENLPEIQILYNKYNITDIISHIIKNFKERLEKQLGENIDFILVGRPVNFHDLDKKLDKLAENRLKEAFLKAGFKNIEFQLEPIGAFNAYAENNPNLKENNNKTLVIDLGGGTSDFSVFDINNGEIKILGNYGVYVGGDDIDKKLIYEYFSENFGKNLKQKALNGSLLDIPHHIFRDFSDKSKLLFFKEHEKLIKSIISLLATNEEKILLGRLYEIFGDLSKGYNFHSEVEQGKINLTDNLEETFYFDMFKNNFSKNLTRKDFEEIIYSEVEKISKAIFEILNQTNLKTSEIDNVILNGGTGKIPLIKRVVEDILGKGKILHGNDLSSVGYGLTLESYERFR